MLRPNQEVQDLGEDLWSLEGDCGNWRSLHWALPRPLCWLQLWPVAPGILETREWFPLQSRVAAEAVSRAPEGLELDRSRLQSGEGFDQCHKRPDPSVPDLIEKPALQTQSAGLRRKEGRQERARSAH